MDRECDGTTDRAFDGGGMRSARSERANRGQDVLAKRQDRRVPGEHSGREGDDGIGRVVDAWRRQPSGIGTTRTARSGHESADEHKIAQDENAPSVLQSVSEAGAALYVT